MDIYRVIFNVSIPCLLSFLKARFAPLPMEACSVFENTCSEEGNTLLKNGECHEWPAAIIDGVKSDNNNVSPPHTCWSSYNFLILYLQLILSILISICVITQYNS